METKLYKYSSTGKVLVYELHNNLTEIVTRKYQLGGKVQEDVYKVVPKAKRNQEEQALLEYNSRLSKLKDDGYSENLEESGKDQLGRIKPMLASPFDEKLIKFPCYIQPKFDGVRCLALEIDGEVHLVSRNGKNYNIPHIIEYLENHRELLPLDGELFNSHMTFQDIVSAVKAPNENTPEIEYWVYDRPVEGTFEQRFSGICDGPIRDVQTELCESLEDIYDWHSQFKKCFEGSIIRNKDGQYVNRRSKDLIKLKDFDDAEFTVIGVKEGTGRDAGTAIFELTDGTVTFFARPTGSQEYRKSLMSTPNGSVVTVKYQGKSKDGVPRFPVVVSLRNYE